MTKPISNVSSKVSKEIYEIYFPGNLIAQQLRIPWSRQKRPLALYGHVNLENSYNYVGDNLLQKQVVSTIIQFSAYQLIHRHFDFIKVICKLK